MKQLVLVLSISMCSTFLQAQKYTTAAGIRLGTGIGITVQQAIWNNNTIEGIVQKGFFIDLTTVSVLYEQHYKLISKGFNFYVGAGPQVGMYGNSSKNTGRSNAIGASFIGGVEMRLKKLLLSFDYKPSINLKGGDGFFDSQSGLSLRYIFIKAQKKSKKDSPKWMFWKKDKTKSD